MRRALGPPWRMAGSTFARDAGALTVSGAVVAVVTTVQGILAARWLGPAGYGAVALVAAFPALILALLSPDSKHATVRYLADRDAEHDSKGAVAVCKLALYADVISGAVGLVIVAAIAGWTHHHVVGPEGSAGLIIVAGLGLLVSMPVKVSTSILMHAGRFSVVALEQVLSTLMRSFLIIVLIAGGGGVSGAVWGGTIGLALHSAMLGWLATREAKHRWGASGRRVRLRDHKALRAGMVRFLIWSDLGSMFRTIPNQLDVVVLGWLVGAREVGFYRLARSITSLPDYLLIPLQSATFPRLARIAVAGRRDVMSAALRRHAVLASTLAAAGLIGPVILPFAVRRIAGDAYAGAIDMSRVLLLASIVSMFFYWLRPFYMASGQVRAWSTIGGVVSLSALALYVPAVNAWGGMGMAIVQVGVAVGINGLAFWRISSILGKLGPTRTAQPRDLAVSAAAGAAEPPGELLDVSASPAGP